jgi:hypothetical protein
VNRLIFLDETGTTTDVAGIDRNAGARDRHVQIGAW